MVIQAFVTHAAGVGQKTQQRLTRKEDQHWQENLTIHPYIAHLTHDSPLLMLIILVSIGALLVPLHHKLETLAVDKLIEKNNRIRLAVAKRTIAKLESKTTK